MPRIVSPGSSAAKYAAMFAPEPECGCTLACRSEEHTSELQSLRHLVCRLLLEKKKKRTGQKGKQVNIKTTENDNTNREDNQIYRQLLDNRLQIEMRSQSRHQRAKTAVRDAARH